MSKDLNSIDISALPQLFTQFMGRVSRYRVVLFIVFVASIYGFITYQIFVLSNVSPSASDVDSEVTSLTPHIDLTVVRQLESLKDNSVNVQTLFDEARENPFSE